MSNDSCLSTLSNGNISDTIDMMDTVTASTLNTTGEDQLDLFDIPNFQGDLVESVLNEQAGSSNTW